MKFIIVKNCKYALKGITVVDFNKDQYLDGYDINLCNRLVEIGLAKKVEYSKKEFSKKDKEESEEYTSVKEPKKTRVRKAKVSK